MEALFALGALPALTAETRDEGVAFALGAVVGRAVVTLLIALALRAGYLRLRRRPGKERALWSPWVLVIAGVFALVLALGAAANRFGGGQGGSVSAESLVGAPPPGLTYERVTGPAAEQAADAAAKEGYRLRRRGRRSGHRGHADAAPSLARS